MLKHLNIRDFAIIESVQLDFAAGMTVLTGETGAGKSILIDALGLLLGDRADANAVRNGCQRADLSAEFELGDAPLARAWLDERELHDADDAQRCLLRRSVGADGRGRAFINGQPCTVRDLKELGETLLDIHGQNTHQSLLRGPVQRDLLDDFGGHGEVLHSVAECFRSWRSCCDELAALRDAGADPQRMEFLHFQLQELTALNLQAGEVESLDIEYKRLSHAGQLLEDGEGCIARLHEDDLSASRLTGQVQQQLQKLADLDPALGEIAAALDAPLEQLADCAAQIRDRLDGLELDPERLRWLDERIAAVHNLARKHHCRAEELPDLQRKLAGELEALEQSGTRVEALTGRIEALRHDYRALATRLGKARQASALKLASAVQDIVRKLGMPQGEFSVAVEATGNDEPQAHGSDRIEYRIRANPGQNAGPISRIASGGELSRIALAIQVVAAQHTHLPSLIFDEIDAGIGGGVAEIVGRQLYQLGRDRQTFCVTHLAQVAAQADQQFYISKSVQGGATHTQVESLKGKARIEEIARMLGGVDITAATRKLAQQMLKTATG